MPGEDLRHPEHLLKGLRHTRRFEDRPVPLDVVDALLAAGRTVDGVRLQVMDDLVSLRDLASIGTFAHSVIGVPLMIVVVRDDPDHTPDASLGNLVTNAVLQAAHQHGLGGGYSHFGSPQAQSEACAIVGLGARSRIVVAIGVGYVDDDPAPQGSSLERVRATLQNLSGNRDRSDTSPDDPD